MFSDAQEYEESTEVVFDTRVCVCEQQCEWQFGKLVKHESGLEFHSSLNLSVNPPLVFVFFCNNKMFFKG